MSAFFFYAYGDPLDLHSFPTRRSSDLGGSTRNPGRREPCGTAGRMVCRRRLCPALVPHARPEDRKSTRLNSSHLGISYAVFCLKKKKTKHQNRRHDTTSIRPSYLPSAY